MPISSLSVGNFKGFKEEIEVKLRPLTVFIGPNSSGKSTVIHSLAALAQTARITKDSRPLVLDDDYAYVHLGRYIEVIHSKSYQDVITLGIGIQKATYHSLTKNSLSRDEGFASAIFDFKCTKRTQEIAIERAKFSIGPFKFDAIKAKTNYSIKLSANQAVYPIARRNGFTFDFLPPTSNKAAGTYAQLYPFRDLQAAISKELGRTLYLGPFRQGPARRYATRGANPTEVGSMGEAAVTMLANEAVQSKSRSHAKQIRLWLNTLGLAKSIDVARIGRSDLFDVALELSDGSSFPLADLGYGLSQILPVLVQCSFAPTGATLLFEQPEIHLHPLSAKGLSTIFRETIRGKGAHIIVETHSPEFVKQVFKDIREKKFNETETAVYRVIRIDGRSVISEIEVDGEGEVYENWEKGLNSD